MRCKSGTQWPVDGGPQGAQSTLELKFLYCGHKLAKKFICIIYVIVFFFLVTLKSVLFGCSLVKKFDFLESLHNDFGLYNNTKPLQSVLVKNQENVTPILIHLIYSILCKWSSIVVFCWFLTNILGKMVDSRKWNGVVHVS